MVEGHQCHRVAAAHRKLLVGHAFKASSPNGRFTEGAAAVHNQPLAKIEVHGKNLFYFFAKAPAASSAKKVLQKLPNMHEIVHVHFGMAGAFKTFQPPGDDPTATTRLRLENPKLNVIAHLSAMTVVHGDDDYYKAKAEMLGPDPLREDADSEVLWESVQRSNKPIGLVLMDQTMIAGLGNIYRAEVLFKARVHPEQPASTITRQEFDEIWKHSVLLLQRGFQTGSIITVDPDDAKRLGAPWTRRYVYNHSRCGFCSGPIKTWDMANRTVYACETCQVLRGKAALPKARKDAMGGAKHAQEFVSHCAAEGNETLTPSKMTVAQIRSELMKLGVQPPPSALKATLVDLMHTAQKNPIAAEPPTQKSPRQQKQSKKKSEKEESQEAGSDDEDETRTNTQGNAAVHNASPAKAGHSIGATGGSNESTVSHVDLLPPKTPAKKRTRASAAPEATPDSKFAKQYRKMRRQAETPSDKPETPGQEEKEVPKELPKNSNGSESGKGADVAAADVPEASGAFGASEDDTVHQWQNMRVVDLKEALKTRNISFPSRALKSDLVEILQRTLRNPQNPDVKMADEPDNTEEGKLASSKKSEEGDEDSGMNEGVKKSVNKGVNSVVPGTQGLPQVATAAEAAAEKVKAGENKAVEHVALGDADVAGNLL